MNKKAPIELLSLKSMTWFLFFAIGYRLTLEFSYIKFISPIFEYAGFNNEVSNIKYIESWLLFIGLTSILKSRLTRPSDFFIALMVFANITPILVFYAFSNASRETIYYITICAMLINIFRNVKAIKFPKVNVGQHATIKILVASVTAVTVWMIFSGGLQFFNLDLRKVYETREEVGEIINQGPMAYLNIWATKVFGPGLLTIALWKKRYVYALMVIALHVVWFGISAHKSVLFYPILVVFSWAIFRNTKIVAFIPIGIASAIGISILIFTIFENILIGSMVIRRAFFVPAQLTFAYYDFFSHNPNVWWSESITATFLKYPYSMPAPEVIGEYMGGDSYANNSFLSTGYMHAGVMGVIIYGIIIGLLFRLIDYIANNCFPIWVPISILIVPCYSLLMSADLPTALLTHGVGMAVFILYLLGNRDVRVRQAARHDT